MKASADRVIIKPDNVEERKIGSIILPQNAWAEYLQGTVIDVGPGPTGEHGTCPMTSKVGDKVIYPPSLGRRVPVTQEDGTEIEYHVVRQHEITITVSKPAEAKTPESGLQRANAAAKKSRGKK